MTAKPRFHGLPGARVLLDVVRVAARRPFASLPSRIITSVFAAALVTSFAVAYTATQSTEVFLRQKIDERFPAVLGRTASRLDEWYAQRELDMATFARSDTVSDSVAAGDDRVAREEARKYLAYVREGFTQYAALFVLDAKAAVRVRVGEEPQLHPSHLERLARGRGPGAAAFVGSGARRFQLISAPIERGGVAIGSLHAMIDTDAIGDLLRAEDLEPTTRIFVVGDGGDILAHSQGVAGLSYTRPIPEVALDGPVVEDYVTDAGEHVVGSATRLPRFGWGIVVEESYDAAFAPIVSVRRRITAINLGIVLGFGLLAFLIARSIVQPIHALSESARRIAKGETDVEIPAAAGHDEIGVLSSALSEMVAKLHRANEDLMKANEELRRGNEVLEQLSFTDGLTRLHNHRYFQDRLRVESKRASRSGEPLALLLLDIDDFKALNDRFGHSVGDEVLRRVSFLLNDAVRETDLPARYGGEEFAVLAPRTGREGAMALAEKLRAAIGGAQFAAEGLEHAGDLRVTVSIGVAIFDGDERRFFNDADRALYRAKAAGKDCAMSAADVQA
jgi:diguanylate cyclase (GGDEF)-like protein